MVLESTHHAMLPDKTPQILKGAQDVDTETLCLRHWDSCSGLFDPLLN